MDGASRTHHYNGLALPDPPDAATIFETGAVVWGPHHTRQDGEIFDAGDIKE